MSEELRVGVDLGGTGSRFVACRGERVVGRLSVPTPRDGDVADWLVTSIRTLVEGADSGDGADAALAEVGIGASGPVDADGVIRNDDTLPAFSHLPLTTTLQESLGVPVRIENDAAAAALGEYRAGAHAGVASLLMITLGTGVGVAAVVDGACVRDARGMHPEGGHIAVPHGLPCYCGLDSCWEQVASRSALQARVGPEWSSMDACAQAARSGDDDARRIFDAYARDVAAGVATWCAVINPEIVVFGGSAARFLDLIARTVTTLLASRPGIAFTRPALAEASLGDEGGAIGAALLTP